MEKDDKIMRVLDLYTRLMNGEVISKSSAAQSSGVNERSIQRDIDDIRKFMKKIAFQGQVVYDRLKKGYVVKRERENAPDAVEQTS